MPRVPMLVGRPELWFYPTWVAGASVGVSGRADLLTRRKLGERLPAKVLHVLDRRPAECESWVLNRRRMAGTLFALLGEWGHCTAHQLSEFTGYTPVQIRNMLYGMLGAGWARLGRTGVYHEKWAYTEFWDVAEMRDVEWLSQRWPVSEIFELFAGRPVGLATRSGRHHGRHDLWALDVACGVAARCWNVEAVVGPGSCDVNAMLGVESSGSAADMVFVRSDGHLVVVEVGIATDGGAKRMQAYRDLALARPGAFTVVFLDMRHSQSSGSRRNSPQRTLAEVLASSHDDRVLDAFAFAHVLDWRPSETEWRSGLPVSRPVSRKVDEFATVELLGAPGEFDGTVPGWAKVYRQLAVAHPLLRRVDDPPLKWWEWLDLEPVVPVRAIDGLLAS